MKEVKERIKNMIKNNEESIARENSKMKEINTEEFNILKSTHLARVTELGWANEDLEEILKMLGGIEND